MVFMMNTNTTEKRQIVRYAVRPASTIRNWYVWAVELVDGKEQWAKLPSRTVGTKTEAKAIAVSMTEALI